MTLVAATAVPGIGELGLILYGLVIGFVTIRGVFLGLARPLPWWLRIPATAAGVGAVGWQFHTPSPEAGVSLLSLMLALKLWEAQSPRDYYITVAMGWFLLVSGFLFNQDLWVTPYLLIVAWGWLTWLGTYFGFLQTPAAWRETGIYWWGAWRLLLPALPLALLLFLFFPRLSAPLWSTRIGDPSSAKTGLSERMAPGSINRLVQSEEIAFRAEFEGPFPPAAERYWRGPVMFQTDGREWWASPQPLPGRPPVMLQRPGLNYRVVMEPSQQNWLFPLDWLGDAPPGTLATRLGELRLLHPLKKRQSFQLSAHPGVPMILPTEDRQAALRLPRNLTPRIRDLAKRFESQAAGSSHRKTIAAVLAYFNTEPFHYSLQPPLTGDRPADEFLFETRQGFCEHFASSFVLLMRLAGLPSRIVTGYQGGEINPFGRYMIIRQSDAHAWAEVWLEGEGWVRVDPTAAVDPSRVDKEARRGGEGEGGIFAGKAGWGMLNRFLWQTQLLYDLANLAWYQQVLSFDTSRQTGLMTGLGLDAWGGYGYGLVLGSCLGLSLAGIILLLRPRQPAQNETDRLYACLCRRLARRGLPRQPWEGALDYGRRLGEHLPLQRQLLAKIMILVTRLRFAAHPSPTLKTQLKILVRKFK